jgi:hypothetical protein
MIKNKRLVQAFHAVFLNIILLFLVTINSFSLAAQRPDIEVITSGTGISLRGLCVVNDSVFWVSGN